MISHKHKFIILTPPRTGAGAFCMAYEDNFDQSEKSSPIKGYSPYLTVPEAKKKWELYWDSYDIYTIVRNPWDKLVSTYCYLRDSQSVADSHGAKNMTFKNWVVDVVNKNNKISNYFKNQLNWYYDIENNQFIGNIIYYENLQPRYDYFAKKYNLVPVALPKVNVSKRHNTYRRYFDDHTIEIVKDTYRKDILALEYTF